MKLKKRDAIARKSSSAFIISTGIVAGAVIGTLIFPGVGTAAGIACGASISLKLSTSVEKSIKQKQIADAISHIAPQVSSSATALLNTPSYLNYTAHATEKSAGVDNIEQKPRGALKL